MTSPRDARLAWALLQIKKLQLVEESKRLSKALKVIEPSLDQEPGDKNTAKLGEAKLGKIAKTEPTTVAVVNDVEAFVEFVAITAPTEIEEIKQVRPAYREKLLAELSERGSTIDSNGQDVPGIGFALTSTPYQRFYPEEGAAELLTVLEPGDLPEIKGVDLAGLLGIQGGEVS